MVKKRIMTLIVMVLLAFGLVGTAAYAYADNTIQTADSDKYVGFLPSAPKGQGQQNNDLVYYDVEATWESNGTVNHWQNSVPNIYLLPLTTYNNLSSSNVITGAKALNNEDNGLVAYCFDKRLSTPKNRGDGSWTFYGTDFLTAQTSLTVSDARNLYTKYTDDDGSQLIDYAEQTANGTDSYKARDMTPDEFRSWVVSVGLNGYPIDYSNFNKDVDGNQILSDTEFRAVTQLAIWYFTDSYDARADDSMRAPYGKAREVYEKLISTRLPDSVTNKATSCLNLYISQGRAFEDEKNWSGDSTGMYTKDNLGNFQLITTADSTKKQVDYNGDEVTEGVTSITDSLEYQNLLTVSLRSAETADLPELESLTLTKEAYDSNDNPLTISADDQGLAQPFEFTIKLYDEKGNQLEKDYLTWENGDGIKNIVHSNSSASANNKEPFEVNDDGTITCRLNSGETIRFDDLPIGYSYEIVEQDPGSFATSIGVEESRLEDPEVDDWIETQPAADSANLKATGSNIQALNTKVTYINKETAGSSLELKKEVEAAEGAVVNPEDTQKYFDFTVKLSDVDGGPLKTTSDSAIQASDITGADATSITSDSDATIIQVSLKDSEKVLIANLPKDFKYEVIENLSSEDAGCYKTAAKIFNPVGDVDAKVEGSDTSSRTVSGKASDTDQLGLGLGVILTFTNTKKAAPLTIEKEVVGSQENTNANASDLFTFKATISKEAGTINAADVTKIAAGKTTEDATTITDATVEKDIDGSSVVTAKIAAGEKIYIRNLELGYNYQVEETEIPSAYSLTAVNGNEGQSTAEGTGVSEPQTAKFTNTVIPPKPQTSNLVIKKELLDLEKTLGDNPEFNFDITLDNASFSAEVVDEQTGASLGSITNGAGTFKLEAGQTAEIKDLPEGTAYTVKETSLGARSNATVALNKVSKVTKTETSSGEIVENTTQATIEDGSAISGTIDVSAPVAYTFENEATPIKEPDRGHGLIIEKVITDEDDEIHADQTYTFDIELKATANSESGSAASGEAESATGADANSSSSANDGSGAGTSTGADTSGDITSGDASSDAGSSASTDASDATGSNAAISTTSSAVIKTASENATEAYSGEIKDQAGVVVGSITNGKGSVVLKAGESVALDNIPSGVTYTITETSPLPEVELDHVTKTVNGTTVDAVVSGTSVTGTTEGEGQTILYTFNNKAASSIAEPDGNPQDPDPESDEPESPVDPDPTPAPDQDPESEADETDAPATGDSLFLLALCSAVVLVSGLVLVGVSFGWRRKL